MAKFTTDCGGLKANIITKAEYDRLAPKKATKQSKEKTTKKGK